MAEAAVGEAFREGEEAARAIEAARKRLSTLMKQNPKRAPVRLRDFLLRRGYPADLVSAVVQRLLRVEVEE